MWIITAWQHILPEVTVKGFKRRCTFNAVDGTDDDMFLIFIWQMSCVMLSSHLYLGLPCDLLVRGFQLNIFLTVLVFGILCTWPNQLSLWALMWLIIFLYFISLSSSSSVLYLHIWFYFVNPNILLKIFFSKTINFWIMASFNTHVS
jgi:hypothetical protein